MTTMDDVFRVELTATNEYEDERDPKKWAQRFSPVLAERRFTLRVFKDDVEVFRMDDCKTMETNGPGFAAMEEMVTKANEAERIRNESCGCV